MKRMWEFHWTWNIWVLSRAPFSFFTKVSTRISSSLMLFPSSFTSSTSSSIHFWLFLVSLLHYSSLYFSLLFALSSLIMPPSIFTLSLFLFTLSLFLFFPCFQHIWLHNFIFWFISISPTLILPIFSSFSDFLLRHLIICRTYHGLYRENSSHFLAQ